MVNNSMQGETLGYKVPHHGKSAALHRPDLQRKGEVQREEENTVYPESHKNMLSPHRRIDILTFHAYIMQLVLKARQPRGSAFCRN